MGEFMEIGLKEPFNDSNGDVRLESIEEFMDLALKMEQALQDIAYLVEHDSLSRIKVRDILNRFK